MSDLENGKLDATDPPSLGEHQFRTEGHDVVTTVENGQNKLHQNLKGRHMQMIAMYVSLLTSAKFIH